MGHGAGRAHRLTSGERWELQRRVRAGETHKSAAAAVGCSAKSVNPSRPLPRRTRQRIGAIGVSHQTGYGEQLHWNRSDLVRPSFLPGLAVREVECAPELFHDARSLRRAMRSGRVGGGALLIVPPWFAWWLACA
jgi:hypothetical protein